MTDESRNTRLLETLISEVKELTAIQKGQSHIIEQVDTCLRGTSYDRGKGVVNQVEKNTKCISDIKRKQSRIIAWGTTIFGAINLAAIITVIIKTFAKG